jgi:hypothetical protein
MEVSTASETEEDPAESDSVIEEAAGSECERKRRKQAETTIPRLVAIHLNDANMAFIFKITFLL